MTKTNSGNVMRELEVLWTSGTLAGLSDAQLLGRFTAAGAEGAGGSAFRELVHRHGPMVMGACRQILRQSHDADDAFQATFLVLVRKARSIHVRDSLAPWLYKVAYRTAMRARASASRYRLTDLDRMEGVEGSAEEAYHLDVRPLLQEELGRLPEKYRSPIVLCHLEGRSHEEAARILRWPVGTVSGRLSRGRRLLRSRLERRGVGVPSAMVSTSLLGSSRLVPPTSLVDSVVGAATGSASTNVSASVLTLTQGVLRAMLLNKLKAIALVSLFVGAVSGGAGVWARWQGGPQNRAPVGQQPGPDIKAVAVTPGLQPNMNPQPNLRPFGSAIKRPSFKNYPTLATDQDAIPVLGMGSLLLVTSADGTALEAKSLDFDDSGWKRVPIPVGLDVTPLMNFEGIALAYKGKSIDRVAAFSARTGDWSEVKLVKPVADDLCPEFGHGCALYQAGNVLYAFSFAYGAWDVLELTGAEKARARLLDNNIQVLQGNMLYVLNRNGKWSKGVAIRVPPKGK